MERSGSGKRAPRTRKPPPRGPKSTGPAPPSPSNSPSSPGPPRPPAGPPLPGGADPPPPPQRGPGKGRAPAGGGGDRLRRAPEIVEFYQSVMRRGETRQTDSRGTKASGGSKAAPSDLIGEITKNSPHLLAVQADVETQGDFVRTLATEVLDATFTNIEDVVAFVTWLDEELSFLVSVRSFFLIGNGTLINQEAMHICSDAIPYYWFYKNAFHPQVDERQVLKHFDWPERRADALRDAAAKHQGLLQLEKQISSFVDDRTLHRDAALDKMYLLFEKTEKSVYKFLQDRDAADTKNNLISRYKEQDIPVGWMSDTGLIVKIKLACVNLAKQYMMRVVSEVDCLRGTSQEQNRESKLFQRLKEQNREVLLLQGVRFAFRVHQFAGGFTDQSLGAFDELKRRHTDGTN